MEHVLKAALISFLDENFGKVAPEYKSRPVKARESGNHVVRPFFYAAMKDEDFEYFISFTAHPRTSNGKFMVECGWKTGPIIPVASVDSRHILKMVREQGAAEAPADFAVRLFWLCTDRGTHERPWDMYSPEAWDAAAETFEEYDQRLKGAATDMALEVAISGGVTEAFATGQARLVGGEVLDAIERHGVPFLWQARSRRSANAI